MPIGTLIFHALMILVCDLDSPDATRNRWFVVLEALIWNIALQGLVQPIVALIVALIICPLISVSILSGEQHIPPAINLDPFKLPIKFIFLQWAFAVTAYVSSGMQLCFIFSSKNADEYLLVIAYSSRESLDLVSTLTTIIRWGYVVIHEQLRS